jgi:hypothetical protein
MLAFRHLIQVKREWLVRNLNVSTKYYVRVFARTKVAWLWEVTVKVNDFFYK